MLVYLNRLSDLLFILARAANALAQVEEPLWKPALALAFAGSFIAGYVGSALGLVLGTLRLPLILVAAGDPSAGAGTNIAISAAAAGAGGAADTHASTASTGASSHGWRRPRWPAPSPERCWQATSRSGCCTG